ncbi:MAG: asparagine synthase (glutamine-hydrolyzing), partial [Candidatus Kapabacteria bacterium]|nr:asparagine synthase (glutamine-hydrolyzing) [Candidatus Kapabacteria bacterium]
NGEVFNYVELRNELIAKGRRFRTGSDTEVILTAYEHWGTSCVSHFNGMWAFALWDSRRQQLFCSRDRLGEKPLYYAEHDGTFVFGSEIKTLWAYGIPKEINTEVLDAYLCFTYIPAPHTFYKNIMKLEAGHNLLITRNSTHKIQYWNVDVDTTHYEPINERRLHDKFSYLFRDSIQLRMRSDVPFGAFLSGGLDSASIVAEMSSIQQSPVQTFTIGFDESGYDERELARSVSTAFGTQHHEYVITPEEVQEAIQHLAWHYDEPFGDATALPTYIVSKIARKHVTMVLTGDGGDEALSGYTIHQGEMFAQQLGYVPKPLRSILPYITNTAARIAPQQFQKKAVRLHDIIHSSVGGFQQRLIHKQNGFRKHERSDLLIESNNIRPVEDIVHDILRPVRHLDTISQLNYWLLKVALPDDMLTKSDRATMAHSLEARTPFLDYRLIELLAPLPMKYKMKGYTRKHILRSTIATQLPPELLSAKKRGFVLPLDEWLRNGAVQTVLHKANRAADAGLVRSSAVERITREHTAGTRNAAEAVWTLAMLGEALP